MRVLHVVFTKDFGGSERYAAGLATAQAEAGYDVRVLIRPQGKVSPNIWDIIGQGVEVAEVSKFFQKWHIKQHIKYFEPDIIHTHLGKAARLMGEMRPKCPTVATLHIDYKAKNYEKLDGLIAINPKQKKQAKKEQYQGEIAEIQGYLGTFEGEKKAKKEQKRTILGINSDIFIFGTLSRLHKGKGIADIIAAFKQLKSAKMQLLVVGSGDEEENLKQLAKGDERIRFIPAVENPFPWYQMMDCFVSASHAEAFGLTLLEAMQAGCPIIATETVGAELALKDQPVQMVPIQNVEKLKQAMEGAFAEGMHRQKYDLTAFSKEACLRKIEDFYKKLCCSE
ncbi:MAG: glycosyltransferase [Alphaproteobacteria bacterium]|nr:glycosyltransferase [Alphaproteobacteria bacterium]MDD9919220.1 glycosyltransferase [Alphaproteobacteria bacterium]